MKKRIIYFLLLFSVLILSACTAKSTSAAGNMPGIDIPMAELNTKVVMLNYPDNPSTYRNGDILNFQIKNRTTNTIVFDQNYGAKIFLRDGIGWKIIENRMGYPDGGNLLPTNETYPPGLNIFVIPDVGDLQSNAIVRIVIIGHVKDNPPEQVGAYIDVQYTP